MKKLQLELTQGFTTISTASFNLLTEPDYMEEERRKGKHLLDILQYEVVKAERKVTDTLQEFQKNSVFQGNPMLSRSFLTETLANSLGGTTYLLMSEEGIKKAIEIILRDITQEKSHFDKLDEKTFLTSLSLMVDLALSEEE